MAYTLKNISEVEVARLSFDKEPCNYIYHTGSSGLSVGKLYKVDQKIYGDVVKILQGNSGNQIVAGDKVFVLPCHPFAKARIKKYLTRVNAFLTNDISKATVIAGNEEFAEIGDKRDEQVKSHRLLFNYGRVRGIDCIRDADEFDEALVGLGKQCDEWNKKVKIITPPILSQLDTGATTLVSGAAYKALSFSPHLRPYNRTYYFTAEAMEILYYVLSKKLKIVTQEYLISSAHSDTKLEDDAIYQGIHDMLSSSDKTSRNVGIEMLIHCDISGHTKYKLWILANLTQVTVNARTKSARTFIQKTDWHNLRGKGVAEMLIELRNAGQLDEKAITELMPILMNVIMITTKLKRIYTQFIDVQFDATGIQVAVKKEWLELN